MFIKVSYLMAQYLHFQIPRKLIEKKLEWFKIQHLPFQLRFMF